MRMLFGAKKRLRVVAIATLVMGAGPSLGAQNPGYIAWWQSFTTPTSAQQVLTEIGFTGLRSPDVVFDIFAFNGAYLTGASLWQATLTNVVVTDVVRLHPMITLAPDAVYALAMSAPNGMSVYTPSDVYSGGAFYLNTGPTTSIRPLGANDLHNFEIQFQAVPVTATPEPATLILVASGLLGIGIPILLGRKLIPDRIDICVTSALQRSSFSTRRATRHTTSDASAIS